MKVVRTKAEGKFNYFQVLDIDNTNGFTEADRNLLFKILQDTCYDFEKKYRKYKTVVF